jgi:hypothetical protein
MAGERGIWQDEGMPSLKEHVLRMLRRSKQPMHISEIRLALNADFGSKLRPYEKDDELLAPLKELLGDGAVIEVSNRTYAAASKKEDANQIAARLRQAIENK